jgi:hypothetical protein
MKYFNGVVKHEVGTNWVTAPLNYRPSKPLQSLLRQLQSRQHKLVQLMHVSLNTMLPEDINKFIN